MLASLSGNTDTRFIVELFELFIDLIDLSIK